MTTPPSPQKPNTGIDIVRRDGASNPPPPPPAIPPLPVPPPPMPRQRTS